LFISGVRLRAPRARGKNLKRKTKSNLKNNDEN